MRIQTSWDIPVRDSMIPSMPIILTQDLRSPLSSFPPKNKEAYATVKEQDDSRDDSRPNAIKFNGFAASRGRKIEVSRYQTDDRKNEVCDHPDQKDYDQTTDKNTANASSGRVCRAVVRGRYAFGMRLFTRLIGHAMSIAPEFTSGP